MLDGARPYVKVRQRVRRRRGEGLVIGPLKSRYSSATCPFSRALAERLHALDVAADELGVPLGSPARCSTPTTWRRECSRQRAKAPVSSGPASTRFATRSPRGCSPKVAMSCRCSAGSAITRPALRSTPTSTCSTIDLGEPLIAVHGDQHHRTYGLA